MNIAKNFDFKATEGKVTITKYRGSDMEVVIPSEIGGLSVISIGYGAFSGCSSLTSVEIPTSVTSIESCAFSGCSSLTSVEIPTSVKSIGDYAFYYCSSLISVEIPNSVTSIENFTFSDCTSLTSVKIPNSVISIENWAFSHCISLTSVTIPDNVTRIGYAAFGYYYDNESKKMGGFTIKGTKGLEAESYAKANGFKFVDVSDISTTEKKILDKRKELE